MSSSTESNISAWDGKLRERGGLVGAVWTDVAGEKSQEICSLDEERPLKELLTEFATDGLREGGCLGGGGGGGGGEGSVTLRLCRGDDIGCEDTGFGPGKGRI